MVKIKGSTPVSKDAIKKAAADDNNTTAKAEPKRQAQKRNDQTAEAKRAPKDQQEAASKQFRDADRLAELGLPPGMTVEQRENQVRKSALGY